MNTGFFRFLSFVTFWSFVVPGCGGLTTLAPSNALAVPALTPTFTAPVAPSPTETMPSTRTIAGTVFPLSQQAPCFLDRYPCQVYEFALPAQGTIGVTLNWDGVQGAAGYVLEAGSSAGSSDLATLDTASTATTFTAANVGRGRYYVRVRARGACGTGAASNEIIVDVR